MDESKYFYASTRPVLRLLQCSGMLPLKGLQSVKSDSLRFSWKSLYFITLTVPLILALIMAFGKSATNFFLDDDTLIKNHDLSLWVFSVAAPFIFIGFSKNYKKMINDIEFIETSLPPVTNHGAVINKIYFILKAIVAFLIIEYSLQTFATVNSSSDSCFMLLVHTKSNFKAFLLWSHFYFFWNVPFDFAVGIFLELRKILLMFLWNMSDALILSCAVYLKNRFDHFNQHLFLKKIQEAEDRVNWNEIQSQYTKLSNLVKLFDRYFNPVTCATCLLNMGIICQRLFMFIRKQTIHTKFYYEYGDCAIHSRSVVLNTCHGLSIIMTIAKTMLVFFVTGELHTKSRKPLEYLGTIPKKLYTHETHRFMSQVYHSKVALSGMDMFYFTREIILTVCGVIVTYELMLFQM